MQLFLHIHWLNIWRFNQSQVTNIWNKIPEISKKAKLEFCTYILRLNGSCITNIYTKKFFRQITELIFLKKFRICITENACILIYSVHFSSVQSLSRVQLFATLWITARQASLSITNSQSLLQLMPIESVMPSSHLFLCRPLLLLPTIPPSIRVFSDESTLRMRLPKYWSFSFSISPSVNIQDWFPLGWTSWISLQSMGPSRVFSDNTVQWCSHSLVLQHHNSSLFSLLYGPTLTSIGEGNGNPLQYYCLKNPMDRGAQWATGHRVAKGQTQLKWLSPHIHTWLLEKPQLCLDGSL